MRLCMLLFLLITHRSTQLPTGQSESERDGDDSKKIIGSSVVTSVSVILNGNEPQFTDAIGKPIPKPLVPLQVASPINLLNPDRYEFYTFDDNGELIKRLMTLKEIQSIVANGDGDGAAIIHNIPLDDRDPEKNVQDIVQSVQNVLTKEVEWKKNISNDQLVLDTPDVSSSWSMILPAIFGNTGSDIFAQKPQQVVMTPDSDVVEQSVKPAPVKTTSTPKPKPTKQTLPTKRRPTHPKKPVHTTSAAPQKIFVNNEEIIKPIFNRVDGTTTEIFEPDTEVPKISSSTIIKIKPAQYSSPATTTHRVVTSSTTKTTTSTTTTPAPTIAITTPAPTTTLRTPIKPTISEESVTTERVLEPVATSTSISLEKAGSGDFSMTTTTKVEEGYPFDIDVTTEEQEGLDSSEADTYSPMFSTTTGKDDVELTSSGGEDEPTTLSIGSILQSLSQSEEDMNAKLSFDQILESLQHDSHVNDMAEVHSERNQSNASPVMYSGAGVLEEGSHRRPTTEKAVQAPVETTAPPSADSADSEQPALATTEGSPQSSNGPSNDEVDGLNVVKYEPLYVELKDPILSELTTETPTTEPPTTELEEDQEQEQPDDEQLFLTQTEGFLGNEVRDMNPTSAEPPSDGDDSSQLAHAVDEIIANNVDKFEEVSSSPQNIALVMESLKAGNMTMSQFKQQAATAASNLENNPGASTEHPYESEFTSLVDGFFDAVEQEEGSNRLAEMAHLSPGLFDIPNRNELPYLESEQKYEKLETITPPSGSHPNKGQSSSVTSMSSAVKETEVAEAANPENDKNTHPHKPVGYAAVETLLPPNKALPGDTLKPIETTEDTREPDYVEATSFVPLSLEPLATEMPLNNQEPESQTQGENKEKQEHNDDKEALTAGPTTAAWGDENVTSEPNSDVNSFSLISTTLPSPKDEDVEEDEAKLPEFAQENVEIETENSVTTVSSLALDDSSTSPENKVDSTTSAKNADYLALAMQQMDIFNMTEPEHVYVRLGETTTKDDEINSATEKVSLTTLTPSTTEAADSSASKKPGTLKPVHYFKQPSLNDHKLLQFNNQRPIHRPPSLSNLKIPQLNQPSRPPVKLDPTPEETMGLEASTMDLQEDVQEFARLCNELAFSYWKAITVEKISPARSLIISPFALTSMLSMVFLGARGGTSGEMNEILKLDDMVTFNPHLVFKNITESVEHSKDSSIASSAFVREIFSDRVNGKILQFFKEKTQQLYSGHVEEVNFNVVNDIIRRRTNLLIKRHTMGKVMEYLRTNSVWVNGPLATVSANLFQTDCSQGSVYERDGEMFFQVHPSIRQRRLIPIPAVVFRAGFTAGYDPDLDATIVAFGSTYETVSTIYIMPGQQGLAAPGDNLERLEHNLVDTAITKNSWSRLLTSLMERPGLEVQLPRFSHRSFINASMGLQRMGLKTLFHSDNADLRGLTGLANKDVYLSDMVQINTFSTCAEEKITDHHHVEMYPAPPLRRRNAVIEDQLLEDPANIQADFTAVLNDNGRAFYDDLLNPKYLELPLPLRPRQARIPESPRLRFDKPFLYFVRHNPTGMILFMGRFNPRLLP